MQNLNFIERSKVRNSDHAFLPERGRGATGLLNKGGGSNRLPALVTKQQAVEFPQVLTSNSAS